MNNVTFYNAIFEGCWWDPNVDAAFCRTNCKTPHSPQAQRHHVLACSGQIECFVAFEDLRRLCHDTYFCIAFNLNSLIRTISAMHDQNATDMVEDTSDKTGKGCRWQVKRGHSDILSQYVKASPLFCVSCVISTKTTMVLWWVWMLNSHRTLQLGRLICGGLPTVSAYFMKTTQDNLGRYLMMGRGIFWRQVGSDGAQLAVGTTAGPGKHTTVSCCASWSSPVWSERQD